MTVFIKGDKSRAESGYEARCCMLCGGKLEVGELIWVWMTPPGDRLPAEWINPTAHAECLTKSAHGLLTDLADCMRQSP